MYFTCRIFHDQIRSIIRFGTLQVQWQGEKGVKSNFSMTSSIDEAS